MAPPLSAAIARPSVAALSTDVARPSDDAAVVALSHSYENNSTAWGKLNEARDNAVLIFTGLSPSAHVASSIEDPTPGWWEEMIGSGLPLASADALQMLNGSRSLS